MRPRLVHLARVGRVRFWIPAAGRSCSARSVTGETLGSEPTRWRPGDPSRLTTSWATVVMGVTPVRVNQLTRAGRRPHERSRDGWRLFRPGAGHRHRQHAPRSVRQRPCEGRLKGPRHGQGTKQSVLRGRFTGLSSEVRVGSALAGARVVERGPLRLGRSQLVLDLANAAARTSLVGAAVRLSHLLPPMRPTTKVPRAFPSWDQLRGLPPDPPVRHLARR
jgi:hypothetical protein